MTISQFDELRKDFERSISIKYQSNSLSCTPFSSKRRILTPSNELLLTLIWLRLYLVERALCLYHSVFILTITAFLFNCSQERIYSYLREGLDVLYEFFEQFLDIPSGEVRKIIGYMVYSTSDLDAQTLAVSVVDGVEQCILESTNKLQAIVNHSGKKGYSTFSTQALISVRGKAWAKSYPSEGSAYDISNVSQNAFRAKLRRLTTEEAIIVDEGYRGIADACSDCDCKFLVCYPVVLFNSSGLSQEPKERRLSLDKFT